MSSSTGKKGDKKHGRNAAKCLRYKLEGRRGKNKELKKLRYELKMERFKKRKLERELAIIWFDKHISSAYIVYTFERSRMSH